MAQTIDEINIELRARFMNSATLMGFYNVTVGTPFETAFSKVSFESGLIYFLAVVINGLQLVFDSHKLWIENRYLETKRGQTPWYAYVAKQYQVGETLVFNGSDYDYATNNDSLKIVKLAHANQSGKKVILKVAKLAGTNPTPLSTDELDAFKIYMNKIQFAGIQLVIISEPADLLKVFAHVYIDSLVLAADGSLLTNSNVFPVRDAVNDYIKNLPFNGQFSITELQDKIQQAVGVINPVVETCEAKYGTLSYMIIQDYYTANAGYLAIDPLFPLSTTITYIQQ